MFESSSNQTAADELAKDRATALASAWSLMRLFLTGTALLTGLFMSSCGLLGVTAQVVGVVTHRGPAVRVLPGTVVRLDVEVRKSRPRRKSVLYTPVVRFEVDGQPREFRGGVGAGTPLWSVGQAVRVRYDARDPDRPWLLGWEMWSVPLLLSGIGGALLAIGTFLWRRRWWERPGFW